jgi:hypothetical protein
MEWIQRNCDNCLYRFQGRSKYCIPSVDNRVKGIADSIEDVYTIVAHGTVQTANNIVDKGSSVLTNISHDTQTAITNLGGSAKRTITNTTSNLEKTANDLKWLILGGLGIAAIILLKK